MSGDRPVDSQHEAIVAQDLKIVARPVARHQAFVVQHGLALISRHREMTSKTIRRPRRMAGVTGHATIGMRELRGINGNVAPSLAVGANCFCPL